jgi:hypothetical protein
MEMKVSIISDIEGMKRLEILWNGFINEYSESPFLLSGFVEQFLQSDAKDLMPRYFVFLVDKNVVGAVPVGIGEGGFRYCRFLPGKDFQPELLFNPKYQAICLRMTLDIIFRRMQCQFADFFLAAAHQSLPVLYKVSKELGVHLAVSSDTGRAVVPVTCSWTQFEKKRRHLRREFERTERRLRESGQLEINWFGKEDDKTEVMNNILKVEEASWKKPYNSARGIKVDSSIRFIFDGCVRTSLMQSKFNWGVALLQLNRKPIAYSLFLEHNGHAYICKTSFDDRYRKHGPGIYVNYAVVRQLMNRNNIRIIDFMSDLPFSHKWASEIVPVNRISLYQGTAPILLRRVLSTYAAKTAMYMLGTVSSYTRELNAALYP